MLRDATRIPADTAGGLTSRRSPGSLQCYEMILEGIVTSLDAGGALNVAPMGPIVDESMSRLRLRPYQSSRTYRNLKATGCGVLHVVDDVLLIARAAIGRLS